VPPIALASADKGKGPHRGTLHFLSSLCLRSLSSNYSTHHIGSPKGAAGFPARADSFSERGQSDLQGRVFSLSLFRASLCLRVASDRILLPFRERSVLLLQRWACFRTFPGGLLEVEGHAVL
jgi:hypothetical protein